MNKAEYAELLKDDRWKEKRLSILARDEYKCVKCGDTKYLHVHHIHYIQGKLPWEVPDSYLETLCSKCHKAEHKDKPIHSFVVTIKKKKPKKYKKKKKSKPLRAAIRQKPKQLSVVDRALQARYDALKAKGMIPK